MSNTNNTNNTTSGTSVTSDRVAIDLLDLESLRDLIRLAIRYEAIRSTLKPRAPLPMLLQGNIDETVKLLQRRNISPNVLLRVHEENGGDSNWSIGALIRAIDPNILPPLAPRSGGKSTPPAEKEALKESNFRRNGGGEAGKK